MMREEKKLKINELYLHRPRLEKILTEGLEKPLVTVVAASGYGKTKTIKNFFQNRKERVVWLHAVKSDNITTHFWHSFANAFRVISPKLSTIIAHIGFPNSGSKFEEVLKHLAKAIYTGERVVFVIDDYEVIVNQEIQIFIENIIDIEIENFCLIIISSKASFNKSLDKITHISTQHLAFTEKEAVDFFSLCDVQSSSASFERMYNDTEGWPIGLSFFAQQYHKNDFPTQQLNIQLPVISDFFDKEYFSDFDEHTQLLFVQLSIFQNFHIEMAEALNSETNKDLIADLQQHPFIFCDNSTGICKFQKLYYNFLEEKQAFLTEEQMAQAFLIAGDIFLKHDMYYQAAESFFKGNYYDRFIHVLMFLPRKRISKSYCDDMLQYISALPESFSSANYLVDYVKAFLLLNNMEMEKAYNIFLALKDNFEQKNISEEEEALLGEVYLVLADISVRLGKDEFSHYYKRAYELLPNGSRVLDHKFLLLGNNQAFFLVNNQPGEVEKMISLFASTSIYAEVVTNGSGYGYSWLYMAEAAYLVYNLQQAEECAVKAINTAFLKDQHDIICNAYMLLAKISLARGNYYNAEKQINKIIHYINAINVTELFELRDCIEGWFHILTGNFDKLPNWMANYGNDTYPRYPMDVARSNVTYALLIMAKGDFHGSNICLAQTEEMLAQPIYWWLRLIAHLMRSVCFLMLNDNENSVQCFSKAYDMTYHNNIKMPFIEFGSVIHPVLELARRHPYFVFDEEWLDDIYQKSIFHENNFIKFTNECYNEKAIHMALENKLSPEEFEILKMIVLGKNTEELHLHLNKDEEEIKRYILDLYIKLGAVNKWDAIRIAKSKKYI